MRFKFRILDLILLTAMVALLIGSFQQDLSFFRQLLCLELTALFSTMGVLLFSKRKKYAWFIGAICGVPGGLAFVLASYIFVRQVYSDSSDYIFKQSVVQDSLYAAWYFESWLALLVSTLFGSAIGPMLTLRVRETRLSEKYVKSFRISVGILSAILLIAVLRMFDRLVNFGDSRDLTPLLLIALVVFVIYTNQWLSQLYKIEEDWPGEMSLRNSC